MKLVRIEVVEDRTATSRCDEGFLTVRRLRVRNVYEEGASEPYPCDIVSRPGSDAVVAVLYERDAEGRIHVWLRESPRVPIYLRRGKCFHHPDPREYLRLAEVVAGLVEAGDAPGEAGLRERAAAEAREEAGFAVPPRDFVPIGGESFASHGTSDEKVYFCAGPVDGAARSEPSGDGSAMERDGRLVRLELGEALAACRTGAIPDMKTELALARLCDHLGYLPQLGCTVDALPAALRARYRRLGVVARA